MKIKRIPPKFIIDLEYGSPRLSQRPLQRRPRVGLFVAVLDDDWRGVTCFSLCEFGTQAKACATPLIAISVPPPAPSARPSFRRGS